MRREADGDTGTAEASAKMREETEEMKFTVTILLTSLMACACGRDNATVEAANVERRVENIYDLRIGETACQPEETQMEGFWNPPEWVVTREHHVWISGNVMPCAET